MIKRHRKKCHTVLINMRQNAILRQSNFKKIRPFVPIFWFSQFYSIITILKLTLVFLQSYDESSEH